MQAACAGVHAPINPHATRAELRHADAKRTCLQQIPITIRATWNLVIRDNDTRSFFAGIRNALVLKCRFPGSNSERSLSYCTDRSCIRSVEAPMMAAFGP